MSEPLFNTSYSIALVGMRGCGKSAVGRSLAKLIDLPFIDTDEQIVESAGMTIATIFATRGESGFRQMETKVVQALIDSPQSVISAGGGAVLEEANRQTLKEIAVMVWLTAPPAVLWERTESDTKTVENRPSLTPASGLEEVNRVLAERTQLYQACADLLVETQDSTIDEVAHKIVESVNGIAK